MAIRELIDVGIAGAGGRGGSFRQACQALGLHVRAVCDINPERLKNAAAAVEAEQEYLQYEDMLERSGIHAVVIGTPMHLHAAQACMALERGIHVFSEVTAAVSIEECQLLAAACKHSSAIYMLAENCNFMKPNLVIAEMARRGLFGQIYYAEGEYLHELKALNELTRWRRKWQTGINGITYGTHSLGPVLQCMPQDRVKAVSCSGSGHHYVDANGTPYENEDSCVMLCRMASGGLVRVRVDMLSNRPYALTYALQGTEGAYESARAPSERHRIWLKQSARAETWSDLSDYERDYLPDWWHTHLQAALQSGHDGSDFFTLFQFVQTITGRQSCPLGIHEAMDMTLPGLLSQQSIDQNGVWLDVPDSRNW